MNINYLIRKMGFIMFKIGKSGKNDIKSEDAFEMIIQNKSNINFMILDVRSADEYSKSHIEMAENIVYNNQNFKDEVVKLDKNKKYLVYCRSGHRSSNATKIMIKLGFTDIHNLSGGIIKWSKNAFPTV
jgi:rhodanese-related sulfurtransferase